MSTYRAVIGETVLAVKGSAIDMTPPVAEDAIVRGRLTPGSDGKLRDSSGRRFAGHGCNIAFSGQFPASDIADNVLDATQRMGFNIVRLHHVDGDQWVGASQPNTANGFRGAVIPAVNAPNSSTGLSTGAMDRFVYFFKGLGSRGIYAVHDGYTTRNVRAAEMSSVLPDWGSYTTDNIQRTYKIMVSAGNKIASNPARNNLMAFVDNFYGTTVTGTSYSIMTHPTTVSMGCAVNEDYLAWRYGDVSSAAQSLINAASLSDTGYSLGANGGPERGLNDTEKIAKQTWIAGCRTNTYTWWQSALTSRGFVGLVSGDNLGSLGGFRPLIQTAAAYAGSLFETHSYPNRGPACSADIMPFSGIQIARPDQTRFVGELWVESRSLPSYDISGGDLYHAIVAALQDIDATFTFAWLANADVLRAPTTTRQWELTSDPLRVAMFRFIAAMRSWGLGPKAVIDQGTLPNGSPRLHIRKVDWAAEPLSSCEAARDIAGFEYELRGSTTASAGRTVPAGVVSTANRLICPDSTVEVLPLEGIIRLACDKIAAVSGPVGTNARAGWLTVEIKDERAFVGAFAWDKKSLYESRRITLFHLTRCVGSGATYRDRELLTSYVTDQSTTKIVQIATAKIKIRNEYASILKVYALAPDGSRLGTIPSTFVGDELTFTANVDGGSRALYQYEIAP